LPRELGLKRACVWKRAAMGNEVTLVLLKPDALERSLTGVILSQLSGEGLIISGAKIVKVSAELAEKHYAAHRGRPFFDEMVRYLQGEFHRRQKVFAMVWYGREAVARIREKIGPTNPLERLGDQEPVTIRQKYGRVVPVKGHDDNDVIVDGNVVLRYENVIHGSTHEDVEGEIKLWFEPEELLPEARIYPTEGRTVRVYKGDVLEQEKEILVWA